MKHKKLFGFLECDTILSGDWSRQGKLHTIENGIRFLAVWGIIISTTNSNNWIGWILIVPSIFGVGFVIKPKFMRPEYEVRLW